MSAPLRTERLFLAGSLTTHTLRPRHATPRAAWPWLLVCAAALYMVGQWAPAIRQVMP